MTKKHRKLPVRPVFDIVLKTNEYRNLAEWLNGVGFNTDDSASAWSEAVFMYPVQPAVAEKTMAAILRKGYGLVAQEVISLAVSDPDLAKKTMLEKLQNYYGLLAEEVLSSKTILVRGQLGLAKEAGMSDKDLASFRVWIKAAETEMATKRLEMDLCKWIEQILKLEMILDRASVQLDEYNGAAERRRLTQMALAMLKPASVPPAPEPAEAVVENTAVEPAVPFEETEAWKKAQAEASAEPAFDPEAAKKEERRRKAKAKRAAARAELEETE